MINKTDEKLVSLSESSPHSKTCARDIMDKNFVTVSVDTTIKSAIEILNARSVSAICVVNERNKIEGIISEYDLLIQVASRDLSEKIQFVGDVLTVDENDNLKTILMKVLKNRLKFVPVVDVQKRLLGHISRLQLLNALIKK